MLQRRRPIDPASVPAGELEQGLRPRGHLSDRVHRDRFGDGGPISGVRHALDTARQVRHQAARTGPPTGGAPTLASLAGGACRIRAVSTPTGTSDQQTPPATPDDRSETDTRQITLDDLFRITYKHGGRVELFVDGQHSTYAAAYEGVIYLLDSAVDRRLLLDLAR
jgi:hypothetical protein